MVIAAASPSPAMASRYRHHPPYKEMILTAIESLKERGGSSRRAISKFVGSTYSDLPSKHPALLALHLRRLKSKGLLEKVKNSYKISKPSAIPAPSDLSPRPRGRPKKLEGTRPVSENLEKRPRGRPSKSLVPLIVPRGVKVRFKSDTDLEKPATKKPRGRPPKNRGAPVGGIRRPGRPPKVALAVATADAETPKRKRGRPPKVEATAALSALIVFPASSLNELMSGVVSKKSGRPPKVKLEKRKPGRPPKKLEVEAVSERRQRLLGRPPTKLADVASLNARRKRGRPPKIMMITNSTVHPTEKKKPGRPPKVKMAGEVASPSGRRRGRPPKKLESALPMDGEAKVVLEKKKGPGRPRKTAGVKFLNLT